MHPAGLLILVLTAASIHSDPSSADLVNTAARTYPNEKAIEFTANSGESTDAFEGFLQVPENRNNPASRLIRVNYVRFPSTGDKPGFPIVYLSGGPGGSGIATAKWRRYPLFQALREFGDVIALDQRGTGASNDIEACQSGQILRIDTPQTRDSIADTYSKAAKECLAGWRESGIDVYGYTTVQNALDLEDLRLHLDAEQMVLWGISYGSHLAFAAMRELPDSIDKVVLASAEGLSQTVKLPHRTDGYFPSVQAVIDTQADLEARFPDVPGLMRSVHRQLEREPLELMISFERGAKPERFLFQRIHLQWLATMVIADPGQYLGMLLTVYEELSRGESTALESLLQRKVLSNDPIQLRLMPLAMDVASGITPERARLVERQAATSLLGDMLNFPMPHLAGLDSELDLGDDFREPIRSDIPTLLFSGTLDGRTYLAGQEEAVSGLSNLTHILVKHGGHNVYMASPEVEERIRQFLAGEPVSRQTIELPAPDFGLSNRKSE